MKERAYPKQVKRHGGLKALQKDDIIFAAYDNAEMRKAKTMIIANSDFQHTSKRAYPKQVNQEGDV